jgi:hypothetical protein
MRRRRRLNQTLSTERIGAIGRAVVVSDDLVPRAFQVFELPLVGHPQEEPGGGCNDDHAEWDEKKKSFH